MRNKKNTSANPGRCARILPPVARFASVVLLAHLLGCASTSRPKDEAADQEKLEDAATPDQKALRALDPYNPYYKVDHNGRVTHLSLNGKHVMPSALIEVGKLTELQMLSLHAVSLTDESMSHLANLSEVKSLYLVGTPMTDKGLVHLERLENLRWLHVPKKTVSKEATEKLKAKLPSVTVYLS